MFMTTDWAVGCPNKLLEYPGVAQTETLLKSTGASLEQPENGCQLMVGHLLLAIKGGDGTQLGLSLFIHYSHIRSNVR